MLTAKLQTLSRIIFEITETPLFEEVPTKEIASIEKDVVDEDSFRARLLDLCNILDRINKRQLDRITGIQSNGSRNCLVNILKFIATDQHPKIDEYVGKPIGMILLIRGYLTHGKNRNFPKALEFLEIENIAEDYPETWRKILDVFHEAIDASTSIFTNFIMQSYHKQAEMDESVIQVLNARLLSRIGYLLDNDNVKRMLLFMLSEKTILDTKLADVFGMEVFELRNLLLPLVPHIMRVRFYDRSSTTITINKNAKELLFNKYFQEGD